MKYLALLAVAPLLSGCWFIFIPGSVIGAVSDSLTGDTGNNCVTEHTKVGDRVRTPGGGWATVESVSGTSMRCTNTSFPVRAALRYDPVK